MCLLANVLVGINSLIGTWMAKRNRRKREEERDKLTEEWLSTYKGHAKQLQGEDFAKDNI
jgi:hypothetical protein